MTSALFSPIRLGGLDLPNRIMVSPMCQYSAVDGRANDWHLTHLGMLANSGAGLLVVEATAVEPAGRITPFDLGLWDDACEAALGRVVEHCRRIGTSRLGIQIAHAGRKASANAPWLGGQPVPPEQGGWETLAPSAIAFGPGWPEPRAMTEEDIVRVREAHGEAARRALRLGFDELELHGAHGYLLHEFMSPITNRRADAYGGSREGRMRFPLEVIETVREVWPRDRALGIRITGSDWVAGGFDVEDAVIFAREAKARGVDFICVSSGGIVPDAKIVLGPGYQVPFAERVRREADVTTRAVGLIATPKQAEAIVAEGRADCVALARAFLDHPHWAWAAARMLGAEVQLPPQYQRAGLRSWPAALYRD